MDLVTNPPHEAAQACAAAFHSQLAMFYVFSLLPKFLCNFFIHCADFV